MKDLGFSQGSYDRAKDKLEKKYRGDRRSQIKLLASLRAWPKIRRYNLEDLEGFLAVLDRILVSTKNRKVLRGDVTDQNLNLTAKEKLPEAEVREYKMWLHERSKKIRSKHWSIGSRFAYK